MKNKRKRYLTVLVLVLLLLGVIVGYSVLSTSLNITGTSKIGTASWNVHYENINITTGSVTATTAPAITTNNGVADTKITYAVELSNPGDLIEVKYSKDISSSFGEDKVTFSLTKPVGEAVDNRYLFGNSFTYNDGTYALKDTIRGDGNINLSNNHYTCLNKTGFVQIYIIFIIKDMMTTLKTEKMYWLNSPYFFDDSGQGVTVYPDGEVGYDYFSNGHGVRPAIFLIPGIRYSDGDGSMANPYIVSTE